MNNNGNEFATALLMLAAGAFAAYIALIVAIYLLFFLAIFAAFVAFAWTFVCLIAWFFPFRLGPIYLDSESARAFILRGIYGAIILPGFLLFADVVFRRQNSLAVPAPLHGAWLYVALSWPWVFVRWPRQYPACLLRRAAAALPEPSSPA